MSIILLYILGKLFNSVNSHHKIFGENYYSLHLLYAYYIGRFLIIIIITIIVIIKLSRTTFYACFGLFSS